MFICASIRFWSALAVLSSSATLSLTACERFLLISLSVGMSGFDYLLWGGGFEVLELWRDVDAFAWRGLGCICNEGGVRTRS